MLPLGFLVAKTKNKADCFKSSGLLVVLMTSAVLQQSTKIRIDMVLTEQINM